MYARDSVNVSKSIHARTIRFAKVEGVGIPVFWIRNSVLSLPDIPILITFILYRLCGSSKNIIDI